MPNQVTGVSGMELLVDDVDAAATLYEKAFGLSPSGSPTKSTGLSYRIGGFELELCEPSEPIRTKELERRTIRIEKEGYAPVSGYLTVVHRQSEDLVDSGFAWWWIFADDEKYQFRESYSYQLKPLVTADQVQ